jgi:hypothetical protein
MKNLSKFTIMFVAKIVPVVRDSFYCLHVCEL